MTIAKVLNAIAILLGCVESQDWQTFEKMTLSNPKTFRALCKAIARCEEFHGMTLLHAVVRYDPPLSVVGKMIDVCPDHHLQWTVLEGLPCMWPPVLERHQVWSSSSPLRGLMHAPLRMKMERLHYISLAILLVCCLKTIPTTSLRHEQHRATNLSVPCSQCLYGLLPWRTLTKWILWNMPFWVMQVWRQCSCYNRRRR